ncbi:hypothetical protein K432DRAFT_406745 [Lepidopterella palustris CBS 459.81]|uniref:Polycomb protein VEFS-Box domain-containing protein n=1 Tax=Lepidopterella palustris CBS 459.81 TaxID=1314670 RepID=A0A8E2E6K5_9PEZI|nr:hypothetical protein K432DRAFT_406745 [Lepidopterella palustris CBS 459.81]
MLHKISKKQSGALKVVVKSLKPLDETLDQSGSSASPSKKKGILLKTRCHVTLNIWDPDGGEIPYSNTHDANLTVLRNQNGQKVYDLNVEPFRVEIPKLHVMVERGSRWKRTIAPKYETRINIGFDDDRDMADLMSHIQPKRTFLHNNHSSLRPHLVATWPDLPKCPPNGHVIQMTRTVDNKTKKLPFGIEVDIGWMKSKDKTMLTAYNRTLKSTRANQLPSPVSEPRVLDQILKVVFVFVDFNGGIRIEKSLRVDGALCAMCHQKDYHTLEELHFHLKTSHDMFTFELKKKEKEMGDSIVIEGRFECELSDRYEDHRASHNVPDAHDINWIAPAAPFNISKYLDGNDEWVASGSYEKRRSAPPKTTIATIPIVKPKTPGEIVLMPVARRKRHKVPRAPEGIAFFRTLSKRPLKQDEYVSESDDDVDMSWLKLRRKGSTNNPDTPGPAKAFMIKFDDYIQDERLSDDVHVGDAIVRFALQNVEWLRRPSVTPEFIKKVTELRSDKIITEEVFERCAGLVRSTSVANQRKRKGINSTPPRTPTSLSTNGNAIGGQRSTPGKRIKYIPGGPGGGGRYVEVSKSHKVTQKKGDDGDTEMEDASHSHFGHEPTENEAKFDNGEDWEATIDDRCVCGEKAETVENVRKVIWIASVIVSTSHVWAYNDGYQIGIARIVA